MEARCVCRENMFICRFPRARAVSRCPRALRDGGRVPPRGRALSLPSSRKGRQEAIRRQRPAKATGQGTGTPANGDDEVIRELFESWDANGDGLLGRTELEEALGQNVQHGSMVVVQSGTPVYVPLQELLKQYDSEEHITLEVFSRLMKESQMGITAMYARGKLAYEIFIVAFAVFVMGINVMEMLTEGAIDAADVMLRDFIRRADTVICCVFAFDFVQRHFLGNTCTVRADPLWFRSPKTIAIMAVEVLTFIPMFVAFSAFSWVRGFHTFRIFRVLRLLRLLSATRTLQDTRFLRGQRQRGAALAILFTTASTAILGAIGVLIFEADVLGGSIKTPGDAVWWALTTMTTVGYGDFSPVSQGGKVVAGVLMLVGVSIFGSVSGLIGSLILGDGEEDEEGEEPPKQQQPGAADIVSEVAALRREVAELKELLLRQARPPPGEEGTSGAALDGRAAG